MGGSSENAFIIRDSHLHINVRFFEPHNGSSAPRAAYSKTALRISCSSRPTIATPWIRRRKFSNAQLWNNWYRTSNMWVDRLFHFDTGVNPLFQKICRHDNFKELPHYCKTFLGDWKYNSKIPKIVRWRLCEACIDFDEIKQLNKVSQKSNFLENNNLKTYKFIFETQFVNSFYDFIFRKFYKLLRV